LCKPILICQNGEPEQETISMTAKPSVPTPTPTSGEFYVFNSFGGEAEDAGTPYSGPVASIQSELDLGGAVTTQAGAAAELASGPGPGFAAGQSTLDVSSAATTPDVFILAGGGFDLCSINTSAGGGNNILDAGAGSDFLTGGSGDNQFYLDARSLVLNQWDTISDGHAGDGITCWGVTPQDFALTWLNGQGASGYTGLTGVFTAFGKPEVGVTLSGYTTADLSNGRLSVSYGSTPTTNGIAGADYFHVSVVA